MDDELRALLAQQSAQIAQLLAAKGLAGPGLTLDALWTLFAPYQKARVKPRTWVACVSRANNVLNSQPSPAQVARGRLRVGEIPAAEFGLADLDHYRSIRIGSRTYKKTICCERTFQHDVITLRQILSWAVERGHLDKHPIPKYRLRKISTCRETVYDEDTLDRLLSVVNAWLWAVILVMVDSGLRPVEVLALEWVQIDPKSRRLRLREAQTKNSKSRKAKLTQRAWDAINAFPRVLGSPWVFTNPQSGKAWAQRTLNTWWKDAREELGLVGEGGERADLYSMRHTFATRLGMAGTPIHVLRDLMGQSDYRQLEKYVHVKDKQLEAASELLEQITNAERKGPIASRKLDKDSVDVRESTK